MPTFTSTGLTVTVSLPSILLSPSIILFLTIFFWAFSNIQDILSSISASSFESDSIISVFMLDSLVFLSCFFVIEYASVIRSLYLSKNSSYALSSETGGVQSIWLTLASATSSSIAVIITCIFS